MSKKENETEPKIRVTTELKVSEAVKKNHEIIELSIKATKKSNDKSDNRTEKQM